MKKALGLMMLLAMSGTVLAEETAAPSGEQISPFERDFRKADANSDGALSREEAEQAKAQLLVTNFDKIDGDKSASLSRDEIKGFLQSAVQNAMRAQQEEFIKRLNKADKNKDGALTQKELKAVELPGLSKNFEAIDANKDKKITMQEINEFARAQQQAAAK